MLTQEWAEPKDEKHSLFKAWSDVKDDAGNVLVTAYAVLRPDGQWSLLLINKDHDQAHQVRVVFHDAEANADREFAGTATMTSFGKAQYQWHANRKSGYADPNLPPVTTSVPAGPGAVYTLPAASISVLRGRL
jgi:hypothetical protein